MHHTHIYILTGIAFAIQIAGAPTNNAKTDVAQHESNDEATTHSQAYTETGYEGADDEDDTDNKEEAKEAGTVVEEEEESLPVPFRKISSQVDVTAGLERKFARLSPLETDDDKLPDIPFNTPTLEISNKAVFSTPAMNTDNPNIFNQRPINGRGVASLSRKFETSTLGDANAVADRESVRPTNRKSSLVQSRLARFQTSISDEENTKKGVRVVHTPHTINDRLLALNEPITSTTIEEFGLDKVLVDFHPNFHKFETSSEAFKRFPWSLMDREGDIVYAFAQSTNPYSRQPVPATSIFVKAFPEQDWTQVEIFPAIRVDRQAKKQSIAVVRLFKQHSPEVDTKRRSSLIENKRSGSPEFPRYEVIDEIIPEISDEELDARVVEDTEEEVQH